jgi:hypothetical protein
MSAIAMRRHRARDVRATDRDQQRGYSINLKQLVLAYAIEAVIVTTSLIGAWLMASKYGRTPNDYFMMMLAPVGYAVVELSRVPLALSTRTQRSFLMKIVALLAVLCAAGVTVKSFSMLGEIMFRPRLEAVSEAKRQLDKVNHDRESMAYAIKVADDVVAQRKSEREATEQQVSRLAAEIGKHPGQTCWQYSGTNKNGHKYIGQKCSADPGILALNQQLQSASGNRAEASKKLEKANADRNALSLTDANKVSTDAEANYKQALFHSQLHSFTAMVFGKDPNQVTDSEIASFLRIFVFVPAILVALASTLLAITSVHRIKPRKLVVPTRTVTPSVPAPEQARPVAVPDEAVIQILKAAVLSANEQLDDAKEVAARTFGTSRGVSQKNLVAAELSSTNLEPATTKPSKVSRSDGSENLGGAEVVQLRSHVEAI